MRKNNCEVIRQELDELTLGETCSAAATEHLATCAGCREFQQQQTRLREIVGSLGTVSAPADFDFRLRARLAGESSSAGFNVYWPFARRGLAVVALVIVFATGVVLVRNVVKLRTNESVAGGEQPKPAPPQQEVVPVKETPAEFSAAVPKSSPQGLTAQAVKKERFVTTGKTSRRAMATAEFSNERATVINGSEASGNSSTAAVFPIDVSLQSLRVSLDDGRGNARTVSVPAISFGSQRVGPNGNQFAPKNVW